MLFVRFGILLILLSSFLHVVVTQGEPSAPQFLLRQGNDLILIDGYTGETINIPVDLSEQDRIEWSPDGTYLIIETYTEDTFHPCINLYDVDMSEWLSSEPIACAVKNALLYENDTQLVYITTDYANDALWHFDLNSGLTEKLYETTTGDEIYNDGISNLEWSPYGNYLILRLFESSMSGGHSSLLVMNIDTYDYIILQAPNTYYATYAPVWSLDEEWILLVLKELYFISFDTPIDNHKGDLYLINTQNGEQHRLTYTPSIEEKNIHWTENGEIAFTEVLTNDILLTLDEAQSIETVSADEIIPSEIEESFPVEKQWISYSADPAISAWYSNWIDDNNNPVYLLTIGTYIPENIVFTVSSSEQLQTDNIAIGWRPTDYIYLQE